MPFQTARSPQLVPVREQPTEQEPEHADQHRGQCAEPPGRQIGEDDERSRRQGEELGNDQVAETPIGFAGRLQRYRTQARRAFGRTAPQKGAPNREYPFTALSMCGHTRLRLESPVIRQ